MVDDAAELGHASISELVPPRRMLQYMRNCGSNHTLKFWRDKGRRHLRHRMGWLQIRMELMCEPLAERVAPGGKAR